MAFERSYSMENQLYRKVYGCLSGGLIGDAMGAPVEGKDYRYIEEHYGEVDDFEGVPIGTHT